MQTSMHAHGSELHCPPGSQPDPAARLQVGQDSVIIEADAIKNRDVIYRSLERMEHLDSEANLSQYVHEYSTRAAESMLVTAGAPGACTLSMLSTLPALGRVPPAWFCLVQWQGGCMHACSAAFLLQQAACEGLVWVHAAQHLSAAWSEASTGCQALDAGAATRALQMRPAAPALPAAWSGWEGVCKVPECILACHT